MELGMMVIIGVGMAAAIASNLSGEMEFDMVTLRLVNLRGGLAGFSDYCGGASRADGETKGDAMVALIKRTRRL